MISPTGAFVRAVDLLREQGDPGLAQTPVLGQDEPHRDVAAGVARVERRRPVHRPAEPVELRTAGRRQVEAATPSSTLFELAWLAPAPRPRLANARQMAHWFSPPVSAPSAARIASRPSTKPGLHGWNFIPSITSWMARLFPPVGPAVVDVGVVAVLGDEVPVDVPQHRVPHEPDAVRDGQHSAVDPGGDHPVVELVDRDVGTCTAGAGCPGPSGGWKLTYEPTPRVGDRPVVGMGGERDGQEVAPALAHLLVVVEAVDVARARR